MRKSFRPRRFFGALLACAGLVSAASASLELTAVNVGKGDALLIRSGGYVALVDTAKAKAWDRLEAALDDAGVTALDAVFITHTDKDHIGGLKKLSKSGIPIGAIYASKYHPQYAREDHPAVDAAERLGLQVGFLGAGDVVEPRDGLRFDVLAPLTEHPDNEDDCSLVMRLTTPDGTILLTGDMELDEEAELIASGADLRCDVLKVPGHADDDTCTPALIAACGARVAVISTDSDEKPGTPAPCVLDALEAGGCDIYVTQDSGTGIRVTLADGTIDVEVLN